MNRFVAMIILQFTILQYEYAGADITFTNTFKIYGAAQFLMVSGRAGRKGSSDSVSEIYTLCYGAHLAPLPSPFL